MTPYYDEDGITLYHGDAREILGQIDDHGDTCITDPVWPNSVFPGVLDPVDLSASVFDQLQVDRLVVHLGCSSDPRFLLSVPSRFPYLRTCWLRYARPSYRGRILIGSDVAYAFGSAPGVRPGRRLLAGETCACDNSKKPYHTHSGPGEITDWSQVPHPAPRRLEHVQFLVSVFSDSAVIDPFCGIGTTLLACKQLRVRCTGIEITERYCEIAVDRLRQGVLF